MSRAPTTLVKQIFLNALTPKSESNSDIYQQSLALLQVLVPVTVMLRAPATVMKQIFLNAPANEGMFRVWRGTGMVG
jgi:hypothetical protein